MPEIRLIPITEELAATLATGEDAFEAAHAAVPGAMADLVREVVAQTLAMPAAPPPWSGYLAIDDEFGTVVGTCAFKTAPDAEGDVEIAYFTFSPFEGRGVATAMARRLVEIASAEAAVRRIVAHTLPEPNASTPGSREDRIEVFGGSGRS